MKYLVITTLVVLLSACSNVDNQNNTNPPPISASQPTQYPNPPTQITNPTDKEIIDKMEETGELPKLDRTDNLTGIDTNNNGIRDDIDTYISQHYTDPAQKKAIEQNAKAMQKAILVGNITDEKNRRIEAKKVSLEIGKSIDCIFYTSITDPNFDIEIAGQMESLMTNTKERLMAYLAYDKALDTG
ncbi:hypothetical protein, partial [Moraxella boevrei]|uniref:hypothetical protein n=1 Tax=Faucicola boevrei TaxID=346665 RepID=UPI00373503D9